METKAKRWASVRRGASADRLTAWLPFVWFVLTAVLPGQVLLVSEQTELCVTYRPLLLGPICALRAVLAQGDFVTLFLLHAPFLQASAARGAAYVAVNVIFNSAMLGSAIATLVFRVRGERRKTLLCMAGGIALQLVYLSLNLLLWGISMRSLPQAHPILFGLWNAAALCALTALLVFALGGLRKADR